MAPTPELIRAFAYGLGEPKCDATIIDIQSILLTCAERIEFLTNLKPIMYIHNDTLDKIRANATAQKAGKEWPYPVVHDHHGEVADPKWVRAMVDDMCMTKEQRAEKVKTDLTGEEPVNHPPTIGPDQLTS